MLLSLPAKEAQILELHSGLSTGGLADDGLKDVGAQEHFHLSISECGNACPQHQAQGAVLTPAEHQRLTGPDGVAECMSFSSSAKHQRIHFNY